MIFPFKHTITLFKSYAKTCRFNFDQKLNEHIWIAEEPNPFDETEKELEAEIPTVPEEGDETVDTTSNPSSKPDSMVICSVGQATRIHCTIMKSVIPHLQRCLTKKVIDKYNLTVVAFIFATDDEEYVYL